MDIYIFYDYESVHISKKDSLVKMTNSLRNALEYYGTIVEKKIYFDSSSQSENSTSRLDMNQAGWHIVDCPHVHGKKETVDKKILMDISFSPLMTNKNAMVCLISNDGDFCDILARLRDRKIFTMVIFTEGSVCHNLLLIPDAIINMNTEIMGNNCKKDHESNNKTTHDYKTEHKVEIFDNIDGCIDLLEIVYDLSQGDSECFLTISVIAEKWYHNQYDISGVISSELRREFRKVRDHAIKNGLAVLSPSKLELAITSSGINYIKPRIYGEF